VYLKNSLPIHLEELYCRGDPSLSGSDQHLVNLPTNIGHLPMLKVLDVGGNTELVTFPETIGELSNLEVLQADHCYKIQGLPDQIKQLSKLTHLDLGDCNLLNLPPNFGDLESLEVLNLSNNTVIQLGGNFKDLPNLKVLDISNSGIDQKDFTVVLSHLKSIPKMEYLDLSGTRIYELPGVPQMENLVGLRMRNGLPYVPTGTHNEFHIKKLPSDIVNLHKLKMLDMGQQKHFNSLPADLRYMNLTYINAEETAVKKLPEDITRLKTLRDLHMHNAKLNTKSGSGEPLPSFENLSNLQRVNMLDNKDMLCTPDLPEDVDGKVVIKWETEIPNDQNPTEDDMFTMWFVADNVDGDCDPSPAATPSRSLSMWIGVGVLMYHAAANWR